MSICTKRCYFILGTRLSSIMTQKKFSLGVVFFGGYSACDSSPSTPVCTSSVLLNNNVAQEFKFHRIPQNSIILDPLAKTEVREFIGTNHDIDYQWIIVLDGPNRMSNDVHISIENLKKKRGDIQNIRIDNIRMVAPYLLNQRIDSISSGEAIIAILYLFGNVNQSKFISQYYEWGKFFLAENSFTQKMNADEVKHDIEDLLHKFCEHTYSHFQTSLDSVSLIGSYTFNEIKKYQDLDLLIILNDFIDDHERAQQKSLVDAYLNRSEVDDNCHSINHAYSEVIAKFIKNSSTIYPNFEFSYTVGILPYWSSNISNKSTIHFHIFGPFSCETFRYFISNEKIFATHMIKTSKCLFGRDINTYLDHELITEADLLYSLTKLMNRLSDSLPFVDIDSKQLIKAVKSFVGIPTAINCFHGFFSDNKIENIDFFLRSYPEFESFRDSLRLSYELKCKTDPIDTVEYDTNQLRNSVDTFIEKLKFVIINRIERDVKWNSESS